MIPYNYSYLLMVLVYMASKGQGDSQQTVLPTLATNMNTGGNGMDIATLSTPWKCCDVLQCWNNSSADKQPEATEDTEAVVPKGRQIPISRLTGVPGGGAFVAMSS